MISILHSVAFSKMWIIDRYNNMLLSAKRNIIFYYQIEMTVLALLLLHINILVCSIRLSIIEDNCLPCFLSNFNMIQ